MTITRALLAPLGAVLLLHCSGSSSSSGPASSSEPPVDSGDSSSPPPTAAAPSFRREPIDYPSSNVTLLGWLPRDEISGESFLISDNVGYVSPSGDEYALVTHSAGITFVRVSDPQRPTPVAEFSGPESLLRDVKTFGNYAYEANSLGGGGIRVFDLREIDQGKIAHVTTITDPPEVDKVQNLVVNESRALLYCAGGGHPSRQGLTIFDLSNPAEPRFLANWHDRYTPDVFLVNYTEGPYAGREIAFLYTRESSAIGDQPGFEILDVTDKNDIRTVLIADPLASIIENPPYYAYPDAQVPHQGWPSADLRYFYLNDEFDERVGDWPATVTRVFDITDLSRPQQVSEFSSGRQSSDHNLYVRDGWIYEANYRSGLRVFETSNPLLPREIAHFDTYPNDDGFSLNGLFNAWPFLPSRVILGSDLQRGLFLWWVGEPALSFEAPSEVSPIDPEGQEVTIRIAERDSGSLVPSSVEFLLNVGQGFTPYPATKRGDQYVATLPPVPCGQQAEFFWSAQSEDGLTWTHPEGAPRFIHRGHVGDPEVVLWQDSMETDRGWVVSGDARAGAWTRSTPAGSDAAPRADRTETGTQCWLTGVDQPGGFPMGQDLDGGSTILTSPPLDLSSASDPHLRYWRWFYNHGDLRLGEETFVVEVSETGGRDWIVVELVGPGTTESLGSWMQQRFRLRDFVELTDDVRVRFVASDLDSDSLVEAALDEFAVIEAGCR